MYQYQSDTDGTVCIITKSLKRWKKGEFGKVYGGGEEEEEGRCEVEDLYTTLKGNK